MTTVTTPSQLKKEVESQKELLLRACLEAFNQLPNQAPARRFHIDVCTGGKIRPAAATN